MQRRSFYESNLQQTDLQVPSSLNTQHCARNVGHSKNTYKAQHPSNKQLISKIAIHVYIEQ